MGSAGFAFEPGDALLVVDVINDFEHDDADALLASFRDRADAIASVLDAARANGTPVIYVNDDHDRWDADAPALVRAASSGHAGGDVVARLAPRPGDRFLLKHRYSCFDHTALDILLERLAVARVILVGAATEGCIVQTAIDAREEGLKATIVDEACATTDSELHETAVRYAREVVGVQIV